MKPNRILVSAGEASGDRYTARLVEALRRRYPQAEFFGCAGPQMREAGVRPVVDASSLSVVGLVEVVRHIPRIYGEFRRMVEAARRERPQFAVLTDSPDFNLRLASRLKRLGIPVFYLVAPQVWAWRQGRIPSIRQSVDKLFCIFPFEEDFFRRHGVHAVYIGHPLAGVVKPSLSKEQFFARYGLPADSSLIALLPGSRPGEIARHLALLREAAERIGRGRPASFLMAVPPGLLSHPPDALFWEPIRGSSIQLVEGQAWDAMAHADLALAASGTVTVEAALLGTPMVTFYRVSGLTWHLGKSLVQVPFYSMVNLVAERRLVPEFIQQQATGKSLAAEAIRLLGNPDARDAMRQGLREVAARLGGDADPLERAADLVQDWFA